MADVLVAEGSVINGVQRTTRYKDMGDGTHARVVAAARPTDVTVDVETGEVAFGAGSNDLTGDPAFNYAASVLTVPAVTVSGATPTQIAYYGAGGELTGDANLTFASGALSVGTSVKVGATPFTFSEAVNVLQLGAPDLVFDYAFGAGFGALKLTIDATPSDLRLGTNTLGNGGEVAAQTKSLRVGCSANDMFISFMTAADSPYAAPIMRFGSGGYVDLADDSGVALVPGSAVGDNQADLGRADFFGSPARWRTGHFGTSVVNAGYFEQAEMTAPAAPAANGVRIYAEDNGAGKTRLMALFSSGAAQQIAIQP